MKRLNPPEQYPRYAPSLLVRLPMSQFGVFVSLNLACIMDTPKCMKENRILMQSYRLSMSILLTVVALCLLSINASAYTVQNSVKIKLLSSGAGWLRFVELNSKSDVPVGIGEIECDGKDPLYTRTLSVSNESGPKSTWLSNHQFTSRFYCENWIENSITFLRDHSAQVSWNEKGIPALDFLEESLDGDTQRTMELMGKLRGDYRTPKPTNSPVLYYTGSRSKYVYIFIHGLFMNQNQFQGNAEQAFAKGINSIVTVLPGHESDNFDDLSLYSENDWLTHSHHLVEIARSMGEKVIVIGHSAGGLIGFNLGLEKQIDGAVLIQPAFGLTLKSSIASILGGIGKVFIKNDSKLAPIGGRMVSRLIAKTFNCKYDGYTQICDSPSGYEIPTIVYTDPKDDVVDTSATEKVMNFFENSQVDLITHSHGHMYIPDLRTLKFQGDSL